MTLVELLVSIVIGALLLAGLAGVISSGLSSGKHVIEQRQMQEEAAFAMERMVQSIRLSAHLQLPMQDDIRTTQLENVRSQYVGTTTNSDSTAVLAVTISATQDLDGNGIFDADSDDDGKIDEDPSADLNHDDASGIYGIDDNGDGDIDEALKDDDDEDGTADEDKIDGIDNDGDGRIDEDPPADQNDDGEPGVEGVDDDGDGSIDEPYIFFLPGTANDDEDQRQDEDGPAYTVYYLKDDQLIERTAIPWAEGRTIAYFGIRVAFDYVEQVIANNVSYLSFTRPAIGESRAQVVDIVLELNSGTSGPLRIETTARLGAALQ